MFLHKKLFHSAVSDGLQVAQQRKERPGKRKIMEDASLRGEKGNILKI
jgi:hypothetical protein